MAVTAVLKSTDYRVGGDETFETAIAPFVWLIQATDLLNVRPREGHLIVKADGETHEVMRPASDQQAAMLNATGHIWTVHTKRIKEANG